MRDQERRILELERNANALSQELASLRAAAGRARQNAPRGRFYVYAPPPTYDPCKYDSFPTTLTWDYQGIVPAGIQDTRTITKTSDLGTILGTTRDGIRGWIGDPDEYPGVGRSSYRFVEELTDETLKGGYAVDTGAGFTFWTFTTTSFCRTHQLVVAGLSPFPVAWVS